MYPRILNIYGDIAINSYGTMIAIGVAIFYFFSVSHPLRKKILSESRYIDLLFTGTFIGIIGGRILFIVENFDVFSGDLMSIIYPWVGGFSSLGTIISVLLFLVVYVRGLNIPLLPLLDLVSLHAPLVQGFGRIGCFLAGCCHGKITSSIISVVYKNPECLAPLHVALIPTQLYESFIAFLIFFFLRSMSFKSRSGELLCLYLLCMAISRFTIDFWRGDFSYALGFLSFSQVIALLILGGALGGLLLIRKGKV